MTIMWCKKRGQRIFLQACISCDCKQRRDCPAYAAQDAAAEAAAIGDVVKHQHRVAVPDMPLLQARGAR